MENNDNKSLGYKVGQILGVIIVGCAAALLMALTLKLIFWMF